MSKSNLIKDLYEILENIDIEYHSDTTYNWSKGYYKAVQDILEKIENTSIQRADKNLGKQQNRKS